MSLLILLQIHDNQQLSGPSTMPDSHFFSKLLSHSLQGLISFCISQDAFAYRCQIHLIYFPLRPLSCLSTAPLSQTFVKCPLHIHFFKSTTFYSLCPSFHHSSDTALSKITNNTDIVKCSGYLSSSY